MSELLYSLVECYHELGEHRAGGPADVPTRSWFADELARRGGRVDEQTFRFARFDSHTKVVLNDELVPSMALYYSGHGEFKSSKPVTAVWDAVRHDESLTLGLDDMYERGLNQASPLALVATDCPSGSLCAINRVPERTPPLPTVVIPGRYANDLDEGDIEVEYNGSIHTGESGNIIAEFGASGPGRLVLTTPLSGWFGCAGERGTGIALLLRVVEEIAQRCPVTVVGAGAHELHYLGANLAVKHYPETPRAVLHLGSSIATAASLDARVDTTATASLQVSTNLDNDSQRRAADIASRANLGFRVPAEQSEWFGESLCWEPFGMPMISLAGCHPLFHVPEDTPARATHPSLLTDALELVRELSFTLTDAA